MYLRFMGTYNLKKFTQLGMPIGTASNRLKKSLFFFLVQKTGQDVCYVCQKKITCEEDLSVEHKIPYLDSDDPVKLFFDLDNIAYSHLSCNTGAGRRKKAKCGSYRGYANGCRCENCTEANRLKVKKFRDKTPCVSCE